MDNFLLFLSLQKDSCMFRKIISLLFIAAPLIMLAQAPPPKLPLDGKKFTAEITEDGKKKPLDPDDISFASGKFKSVLFADEGWDFSKAAKYQITKDSTTAEGIKIYSWVADLVNANDEKLAWSGSIKEDDIEGTIELVNRKGKTQKTYAFTGKLKKKPGGHK